MRGAPMLSGLVAHFDALWRDGVPLEGSAPGIKDADRTVLSMLAAGSEG